jgi:hypothetical protein
MKVALGVLRAVLMEALEPEDRSKFRAGSVLGVKDRDVHVSAGSKLAKRIEPELVDMIAQSYANIGGNPKVKDPGDLSAEYPDWWVADVDDDPDVDVLVAGDPRPAGVKLGALATDGSAKAKAHLAGLLRKLYAAGWWGEVSGAFAHLVINKLHVPTVDDEAEVRRLLGNKAITWYGDHPDGMFPGTHGWYSRDIGGHQHTKIIVGNV